MLGIEFPFPVSDLRSSLINDEQVFTGSSTAKNVLRLLPPLNIRKSEVDMFIGKLQTCLNKQLQEAQKA